MTRQSLAVLLLSMFATLAHAADYPVRPITFIVPWGAGGGTDAVGRVMASLLERDLGRPVNVVNRTGGSGVVGHSAIANARPDGYTIGISHGRDRDDASSESDQADRCVVHAPRA